MNLENITFKIIQYLISLFMVVIFLSIAIGIGLVFSYFPIVLFIIGILLIIIILTVLFKEELFDK